MRFSCGISSRSDYAKKFIEQFPPTKAQSTKIGCAFSLPAPYSEERRRAASEAAKKCGVHRKVADYLLVMVNNPPSEIDATLFAVIVLLNFGSYEKTANALVDELSIRIMAIIRLGRILLFLIIYTSSSMYCLGTPLQNSNHAMLPIYIYKASATETGYSFL